ncbi:elf1 [Symbiodinium sp. CCMP2592]|nr:elf1 [Symbiodinium sp. CCMP2592]
MPEPNFARGGDVPPEKRLWYIKGAVVGSDMSSVFDEFDPGAFQYTLLEEYPLPLPAADEDDPLDVLRTSVFRWAKDRGRKLGVFRSPQWPSKGYVLVGKCVKHTDCHAGKGRHFKFHGGQAENLRTYILSVWTSGTCSGKERVLRPTVACGTGPTHQDREDVLQIADQLLARNVPCTPTNVAAQLKRLIEPKHIAASLRQRRRQFGANTSEWLASIPEFEAWAVASSNDYEADLRVARYEIRPEVRWVLLVRPFWEKLEELLPEPLLDVATWLDLVAKVFLATYPGHVAYQEVVDVFREELHRRGMAPPKQLHTDWFPGFPAIVRASLPGCRLRQGIEHARRAIRRNHNSGTAQARGVQRRRRSRAARGRGQGGGGRRRGVAAEQPLPIEQGPERAIPPHLTSRPIGVFLRFVSESMFLPTMLSFHLFWKVTRRRMEHWPDPQFANYFFQRYIKEELFQVAGRSLPGLPASQQTAEQALRRTVRIWSQPLTAELAKCDKGRRFRVTVVKELMPLVWTLMATPGGLHLQRPQTPDPWMLADGQTIRRPGGLQTYFPSIHTIIAKSKVRQGISIQHLDMANKTFLAMAVGKPVAVPHGHACKLYDLLGQQTEAQPLTERQFCSKMSKTVLQPGCI